MKSLIAILAILLIYTGCRKNDIHLIGGKFLKCDVSEQSWNRVGFLVGQGFKKTYYDDVRVKTVTTILNSAFPGYDSLIYHFTYANNKANVATDRFIFIASGDGEGGHIYTLDPETSPVQYNFTVEFDPKTGNAVKAGNTVFNYNKYGKLTGYDTSVILYDDKGNITRINGPNGQNVQYGYDYTKTAKQQMYYTSGVMIDEMYNLMETMHWIPVEPTNLRIWHRLGILYDGNTEDYYGIFYFSNHKLNSDGFLTSFDESFYPDYVFPEGTPPVSNKYHCQPIVKNIK